MGTVSYPNIIICIFPFARCLCVLSCPRQNNESLSYFLKGITFAYFNYTDNPFIFILINPTV